jgi:hypothetical protein
MLDRRLEYQLRDGESYLDADQNARLVANPERLLPHEPVSVPRLRRDRPPGPAERLQEQSGL